MTRAGIVGIDLGTTNSACAVLEDGKPRMIENALGEVLTPSVVAVDSKLGSTIVGRTAKDISAVHPHLAASQFKREMGNDSEIELHRRKLGAVELSAYVLNSLREDAERELGHAIDRAVVTVPAYFNDKQRFATKRAAEVAGLTVERILNEPTAAAIAYGLDKRDVESQFAVIDLGGGTFDVCIMELFEGLLSVKSVAGESRLGGEDFTAQLAAHACSRSRVDYERMKREDPEASALLYKRCEVLKRTLSRWESAGVTVPIVNGQSDEPRELEVTAAEAWAAFAPLVDRLHAPIRAALRGANITPDKLDEVVLVGGATRMPPVREFVERLFERKALTDIDPDLVVAHGAAVQAALCADDLGVDDIVVTDIASHSLGVNVVQQIATRYVDGFFQPVIHRNTVIPTSKSERFHPVERGQRSVHFGIYEGEARRVADNTKLGEFDIDALPKENGAVDVRFTYDLNGILEVEATVVETGKMVSHVFQREGKKLSEKELDHARSRMRAIRSGPRQRPQNRDLLARAELLWQEAGEEARIYLSRGMTEFESALESRDADAIKLAYDDLLQLCASLDDGERW